jgi:general secretion pathway protein B
MSYILDALRKAEAERRMGGAPDVRTAPIINIAQADRRSGWRGARWLWALPAAAAGALATLAWLQWHASAPANMPAPVPVATPAPIPAAEPMAPPPPAVAVTMHQPPPPAVEAPRRAGQEESSKHAPGRATPKADDRQPPAAVATLRELPAEIQRQIPPLSISGYIYAANAADRSVLINRKLLREGDEIAPGLTLEKLMPKGLILNYKGYRYRSGY